MGGLEAHNSAPGSGNAYRPSLVAADGDIDIVVIQGRAGAARRTASEMVGIVGVDAPAPERWCRLRRTRAKFSEVEQCRDLGPFV